MSGSSPYGKLRNCCFGHLEKRSEEQQFDALADLFPEDSSAGRRRGKRTQGEQPPSMPPDNAPLAIIPSASGFTVRIPPIARSQNVGSRWVLRCAYDVARGGSSKALRSYERGVNQGYPDFSLPEHHMRIRKRGCDVEIAGHNELHFTIINHDFRINVTGFDSRDVVVVAQEVKPATTPRRSATAMIRRFNYTKRKQIARRHVRIHLGKLNSNQDSSEVPTFRAEN